MNNVLAKKENANTMPLTWTKRSVRGTTGRL
jgi:hypothetical protein